MNVLPGVFGKTLDSGLDWDKRGDSTVITTSSSKTVKQSNVSMKGQGAHHSYVRYPYRTIEDFVREQQGTALLSMMRNDRAYMLPIVQSLVDVGDLSDDAIVAQFQDAVTNALSPPVENIEQQPGGESGCTSLTSSGSPRNNHAAPQNAAAHVAPFAGEPMSSGRQGMSIMMDPVGSFSAGGSTVATNQAAFLHSDASDSTATAANRAVYAAFQMADDDDASSSVCNYEPVPVHQGGGQAVSPPHPQLPQNSDGMSVDIERIKENQQDDQQDAAANANAAQD
jgi:hypothetical protein